MTDISSHSLLNQAYDVCQAIEKCGASTQLTDAVCLASNLMRAIEAHLQAARTAPVASKIEAIQGESVGFGIDPLESAIASTISLMNDHAVFLAESRLSDGQRAGMRFLGEKLNSHLNALLTLQLERVGLLVSE